MSRPEQTPVPAGSVPRPGPPYGLGESRPGPPASRAARPAIPQSGAPQSGAPARGAPPPGAGPATGPAGDEDVPAVVGALAGSAAALDGLAELPVAEHVARYDALHGELSEALAAIDGI